jgi:hypothetical protein
MCFSAEASFTASAALVPCGVYCYTVARYRNPNWEPLALIPFFFGIQQFFEGMVWLGHYTLGSVAFLFFAVAFWPIWIPWSMYCITRRWEILLFILWGVGFLLIYLFLIPHPVEVTIVNHSIKYGPVASDPFMRLTYLLNVVAPVFFTKDRILWLMGLFTVVSGILSHMFLSYAFVSLWCFFAAVISLFLCYRFYTLDDSACA